MKKLLTLALAILSTFSAFALDGVKAVSGIYCGGHIRRGRPGTYTKIKESGFTYVILFNVNVEQDGTLTTDGQTICKDGKYVFGDTNPYYASDVKGLKEDVSSVQRIEICIGGWGNASYGNIKKLIGSASSITSTHILYKNFKALKEAVPEIDAVNNDQEQDYDVDAAVKFHVMMSKLGYKTTAAPYTMKNFWQDFITKLNSQRKGACDRVMVQCYDGGANNNPKDWHINGIELHAGLLDYSNDWSPERNLDQFDKWHTNGQIEGGFVWLFNDGYDENWDMEKWATGLNRMFKSHTVKEEDVACTVFESSRYNGYSVDFAEGMYDKGDLLACGVKKNDIESAKIKNDYVVRFFKTDACTGSSLKKTADATSLSTYANAINSIIVISTEHLALADSAKALASTMKSEWANAKDTIKKECSAMLNDPAFKEKYNALDADVTAYYKLIYTTSNDWNRYERFQEFVDTIQATRAAIAELLEQAITTGIATMESAQPKGNSNIYDLSGRQINASHRGIRIVNGKKIAY